jgi:16S rRNA (cytosine1402-N4)-methyltransferase
MIGIKTGFDGHRGRGPRSSSADTESARRSGHIPVLLNEVITVLDPQPGEFFIDATYGAGGHARAIREKISPKGNLLGIDWERTGDNYADLPEILKKKKLPKADGLLIDLGFSSDQLATGGKGFSFLVDEPLLMTYSEIEKPVAQIIRELKEAELTTVIKQYGEERYARRIAVAIKAAGKKKIITTSKQLAMVVAAAVPRNYEQGRIHPATRTFQALRIYANRELENLETILKSIFEIVGLGGRVAIISFHSIEDRIVKNYFRDYARAGKVELITKKPVQATETEVKNNPRSRSAKLRAAKVTEGLANPPSPPAGGFGRTSRG